MLFSTDDRMIIDRRWTHFLYRTRVTLSSFNEPFCSVVLTCHTSMRWDVQADQTVTVADKNKLTAILC